MHSHNFIVELIVAVGGGQERVTVCYEHVEKVHHLGKDTKTEDKQTKNMFSKGESKGD